MERNTTRAKTEQAKPTNSEPMPLKLVLRRPNSNRVATAEEVSQFTKAFNKSRGK